MIWLFWRKQPISNCLLILSQLVYFSHVCIASYNSDFFFFIDGYSILITRLFCTCFNTLRVIKTKKTLWLLLRKPLLSVFHSGTFLALLRSTMGCCGHPLSFHLGGLSSKSKVWISIPPLVLQRGALRRDRGRQKQAQEKRVSASLVSIVSWGWLGWGVTILQYGFIWLSLALKCFFLIGSWEYWILMYMLHTEMCCRMTS